MIRRLLVWALRKRIVLVSLEHLPVKSDGQCLICSSTDPHEKCLTQYGTVRWIGGRNDVS